MERVLLSCKISNSVLTYLEHEGLDTSPLLEQVAIPEEFLRDTSYWLPASELENLLRVAEKLYQSFLQTDFIESLAHSVPDLRAWGLLDSVLRMMAKPQDILSQPERFLSYFISPQPPVDRILRSQARLEFDVPMTSDQYPLLTSYMKSAFETLPVFSGQPQARCQWNGIHFSIEWAQQEQKSIFTEVDVGHQISPELLRSVLANLEQTQRDLDLLRSQKESPVVPAPDFQEIKDHLRQNILKLSDYMVRAQQLITILVSQNRMSPGVQEAMRRVDWERVTHQYPQTVQLCQKLLTEPRETLTLKDFVFQEPSHSKMEAASSRKKSQTHLQQEMFHVENP